VRSLQTPNETNNLTYRFYATISASPDRNGHNLRAPVATKGCIVMKLLARQYIIGFFNDFYNFLLKDIIKKQSCFTTFAAQNVE